MQFTTFLATSLLAFSASTLAAPTSAPIPNVTVVIANDVSGAESPATVPADNVPRRLVDLLGADSAIVKNGLVATSARLTQFQDGTKCALVHAAYNLRIELDGRSKNFVDLDGDVTKPIPIWIGGFTFQCTN